VETVAIAVAAVIGMVAKVEVVAVLVTVSTCYTHRISSNDSNKDSCNYWNDGSDYHTHNDSNNDRDNTA
jgi:hypothetical protein